MYMQYKDQSGKVWVAEILTVYPTTESNIKKGLQVYRLSRFESYNENCSIEIMGREYTTKSGLIRAAKKYGITKIKRSKK